MLRVIVVALVVSMVPVGAWAQYGATRWLTEMNEVELQCQQMDMELQQTMNDCRMQALRDEQEAATREIQDTQRQMRRELRELKGESPGLFD
jgi:hypothetical protein